MTTDSAATNFYEESKMTLASRAEALFVSSVQPSEHLTARQLVSAIRASVLQHGGPRACAAAFAAEYGEHPETSRDRMKWALTVTAALSSQTAQAA